MLNAGQKYCRMLQGEHSAILSTFIKLPFVINIFILSIFEWSLKTGFPVISFVHFPRVKQQTVHVKKVLFAFFSTHSHAGQAAIENVKTIDERR